MFSCYAVYYYGYWTGLTAFLGFGWDFCDFLAGFGGGGLKTIGFYSFYSTCYCNYDDYCWIFEKTSAGVYTCLGDYYLTTTGD